MIKKFLVLPAGVLVVATISAPSLPPGPQAPGRTTSKSTASRLELTVSGIMPGPRLYRKENWELAVYPVEGHAFDQETNWADEYTRILKLFETNLRVKPAKAVQ